MRKNKHPKTLVILTGPTAVGKTGTSLALAEELECQIISADARQFYRELQIGTAAPTPAQMQRVPHHLAGHLSIYDTYNAHAFEKQAMEIIDKLFLTSDYAIVSGGSGLYIDALCYGIDQLPDINPQVRKQAQDLFHQQGLEGLRTYLAQYDPEYYSEVDISNPNRMMRGVEIHMATGMKYSQLRTKSISHRPFNIKKIILNMPRQRLWQRIGERTQLMVNEGLIEEAITFFPQRYLNALNTVGYKELFEWLSGKCSLQQAIENIRTNTRRYAKRQITWFKKYDDARWYLPTELPAILKFIRE